MKKIETKKIFDAKEFNNIKEVIYNSAKVYGDNVAFRIKNKVEKETKEVSYTDITYKKLLEDVNSLGTALYSLNLKSKRVAVIGKNRYEWVVSHLANLLGSIISVPLDKDLQLEELENSLIRSKADAIVFDTKLLDLIKQIQERGKTNIKYYICMDKFAGYKSVPELIEKGKEIIEKGNTSYIKNKVNNNTMSILLFTSGTTSKSKAVMLTQKNIASNIYALQCVEDLKPTDTNIAFLPFHHIFGSTCILLMLGCGMRTVFPDGLRYIKQNMQEYGVSVFVGVPVLTEAIYKAIVKEVEKQGKTTVVKIAAKISNLLLKLHIDVRRKLFKQILDGLGGKLRLVISGGAPSDPVSIKGFNEIGVITLQGYGLSETGPVISAENYHNRRIGSVGTPMINDKIEIVNKDQDGIGEIRVKGPNIMLGYYEMPELTDKVLKNGWFYTGDLGYFDKNGYLFITGRSKDMIVFKNGKKAFPEEMETVLNRIELINECMVFGMPDEKDPTDVTLSVKAVLDQEVIKEKYSDKSADDLYKMVWNEIKEANNTFPRYKHIQKLIISEEELIKTTTKKIKRHEEMKKINQNT